MPKVIITPTARRDIKGIALYTQGRWGLRQRSLYMNVLEEEILTLAETRRLDDDSSDIRPGLLSCRCQKHRIFFWRDDQDNIEVLRVLGKTMDFARHL